MDDPEQRAALRSGLNPERHGAVWKWSGLLPHSVPDLDAGNGCDGLWLSEVRLGQPSLAKGRNGYGAPYLLRRRLELILERDFRFLTRVARHIAH